MKFKYLKHTKGQALLFVVVAMTVALSVGVAISTRNLSSSSRISRTDTSVRVLGAAEGGIEKLLSLSDSELDSMIAGTTCPGEEINSECVIKFNPATGDSIQSQAIVSVEKRYPGTGKPDVFTLDPGLNKEVVLDDGVNSYGEADIQICWNEPNIAIYYISYNSAGDLEKGLLWPTGCIDCDTGGSTTEVSSGDNGYAYCGTVGIVSNPYGLRIKSLYNSNSSKIAVYPTLGDLPSQGYDLKSTGQLVQDNEVTVSKLINVYRSYAYLPGFFDYGVYTNYPLPN